MLKELSVMNFLSSVILFCAVVLLHLSGYAAGLASEEENVLRILRQRFNQPNWTDDPCANVEWIKCSDDSLHVSKINLANFNLTGPIPAEVSELRYVQELVMNENGLNGSIPDISNMTELINIDLNTNNLSGPIPDTSAFRNITRVVLNDNNLTGGIPADLFKHPKLQLLYVGNNPLGGSLPDMSELTSMKELSIINASLTGSIPESIQNMTDVTHIVLYENPGLTGSIPNISALAKLQYLSLRSCGLNGSLPDLRDASDLVSVELYLNDFSGQIPPALFQHQKLQYMSLNNNSRLSGEIPDTTELAELVTLSLNDCNLTGPIPPIQKNINLQYLQLQNNKLTTCPSDLRNLTQLVVMKVSNNSIEGKLPDFPPSDTIQYLVFFGNRFSGGIPKSWSALPNVFQLQLEHNNLSGALQEDIGNITSLKVLLLSDNKFSGPIPKAVGRLNQLEILDLSNNHFSGIVPEELAALPKLHKLLLHNNNFSAIPEAILKLRSKGLNLTYDANIQILAGKSSSGISTGAIVGIVAGVIAMLVFFVVFGTVLFMHKKRRRDQDQLSKENLPKSAEAFSLKEVKAITGKFKTVIGKGGFGTVYYGQLSDGKEVAVKVRETSSKQGSGEFLNEVRLLSRLHHRNLVPLVGYCLEENQQILIYAYMPQGSLHDHVFNTGTKASSRRQHLSWITRLEIVLNAARGLEYLHKDCNPPVIHRDVKASNILLTENLLAKISDLGLSKQIPEPDDAEMFTNSGITTAVKGTFGYLDPEYYVRRKLSTKSDVFSFGVVLLEIITGRRAQSQDFPGDTDTTLIEWVQAAVNQNQIHSIIDPAIGTEYNKDGMWKVVRIALSSVLNDGGSRPDMAEILVNLTEALEMEEKPKPMVHTPTTVPFSGQLSFPAHSTNSDQSWPSINTSGPPSSSDTHSVPPSELYPR